MYNDVDPDFYRTIDCELYRAVYSRPWNNYRDCE